MEIKEKEYLEKAWLKSAQEDFETAEDLVRLKHYHWALFLCHIAIEKVLKAIYIKVKDQYPPPIHKLAKLAQDCRLSLTQTQLDDLEEMTTFHIEARYDVIKDKLYKKATKEFTLKYLEITKKLLHSLTSLI